jgi:AcrR family transcriptional regulator
VFAAGVALADAEGLPAVTMRRLAADLGVEAMSLYHHVRDKDGLLDGLVETVITEIQTETAGLGDFRDWRDEVRRRCLTARLVMIRHPWAPGLIGSRPSIPVGAYLHFDTILAAMIRGGFSYRLGHRALHALGSMALGFVAEAFSPDPSGGGLDPDLAEEEFAQLAGLLPHLGAMVAAEVHDNDDPVLGWCDSETEFEFTLDLILDGLARANA